VALPDLPAEPTPAIVLTDGLYATPNGKTAHGLVRGSDRFQVVAVIDAPLAGCDAGEVLDGRHRAIPVLASSADAFARGLTPECCIVGVATHGGHFTPGLHGQLLDAARRGLSLVNGLHDAVGDDLEIATAAAAAGAEIVDLRRPRPKSELHFWEGRVHAVRAPRIVVLGTDCALGKRTTARMLVETLRAHGLRAEMIYTGQTGWMQGARYGFILDATYNDYVSGELEHALVTCDADAKPDVIVIEGQSSLRNPSGPCGAEFLLSGAARGVVLQHAAGRRHYEGYEALGLEIPPVEDEIALIAHYGARTLGVAVNREGLDEARADAYTAELQAKLGIPVVRPLAEGLSGLVPAVREHLGAEARLAGGGRSP
jgi:uncharacterized NAD-dependent epimerase/dehydratase family protein